MGGHSLGLRCAGPPRPSRLLPAPIRLAGDLGLEAGGALEPLRTRVVYARALRPFGVDDARSYVRYHLQRADASPDLFNDAAIKALFQASRGHPRVINQLVTQALIDGAVAGHDAIGLPLIRDLLAAHPLHPQARPR